MKSCAWLRTHSLWRISRDWGFDRLRDRKKEAVVPDVAEERVHHPLLGLIDGPVECSGFAGALRDGGRRTYCTIGVH